MLIELKSDDDWQTFVDANHNAIVETYGSVDEAYTRACQGGLTLGGGSAPLVEVHFID